MVFTSLFAGTSISSCLAFLQHFLQFCFTLRDRSPKTLSCFVFHFFSESPYGAQRRSLLGSYYMDSMSGLFDCGFNIHVKILRLTAVLEIPPKVYVLGSVSPRAWDQSPQLL